MSIHRFASSKKRHKGRGGREPPSRALEPLFLHHHHQQHQQQHGRKSPAKNLLHAVLIWLLGIPCAYMGSKLIGAYLAGDGPLRNDCAVSVYNCLTGSF